MAEDVEHFIQEHGMKDVTLLGHSMYVAISASSLACHSLQKVICSGMYRTQLLSCDALIGVANFYNIFFLSLSFS